MNRDGKQITSDDRRQGIVFMKMLIVSARLRLIPGRGREVGAAGRGRSQAQAQAGKKNEKKRNGKAVDWTSTAPLAAVIGAAFSAAAFVSWTPDVL